MAKISLENFRKYEQLSPLTLNSINIFVGKNNAGKSTVVKAILLALDNLCSLRWKNIPNIAGIHSLKSAPIPYFRFDANDFHNLHIGTFERAKCNYIDSRRISICVEYCGVEFTIIVAGTMGEGQVSLPIESIKIDFGYDNERHPRNKGCYEFNFSKKTMTFNIQGGKSDSSNMTELTKIESLIGDIETQLKEATESENALAIAELQASLVKYRKSRNQLAHNVNGSTSVEESFDLSYFQDFSGTNILSQYIRSFLYLRTSDKDNGSMLGGTQKTTRKNTTFEKARLAVLSVHSETIEMAASKLDSLLSSINVDYIQAHAATQKLILSTEDRHDINSRAVHDFYQEHLLPGDKAHLFLTKWLKSFEIGNALSIKPLEGEGYYVIIDTGEHDVHLADMGMGSIQLVILLLRLATIANRIHNTGQPWWVIIEEPEQNIHPMLQSKLAELFKEFNEEFCSTLIIETHSEYLVRNTQTMVIEQKFRDQEDLNSSWPFRVFYFPSEFGKQPYDMKYQPDGRFAESFGKGFYDEAGTLSMQLHRKVDAENSHSSINWDSLK